ncbi:Uncharacterized protein Adt_05358 [Abeliophyllum distichum]|uniref:Uncharacterized protein n=1 Tax=Abeliophyllum distichum TaxID=126358 RepID=A0ABD1V3W3_9LAMI
MVDTGATHNYLASPEVERIGLELEKDSGKGQDNQLSYSTDYRSSQNWSFFKDTKIAMLLFSDSLMMMEEQALCHPHASWKKEFEDVMPEELLRRLPPRRAIDHNIELISGRQAFC